MKNNVVVDIQHVYFSYGEVPVLEDVNITVEERDFLSIIGPNGGGKTTILNLILGLIEPSKGTVQVLGKSPKKVRKRIGYLPQLFKFDFSFPISVMEVVLMGRMGIRGVGRKYTEEDIETAHGALEKVGLEEHKERQIGDLSGGQRQRVFIARALSTEPKLLLLDEPVSSVDAAWQKNFYALLQELNKEVTIIMVTHDISIVSMYIDKIACINKKLYYHGSKKDGFSKIQEMQECPVHMVSHEPLLRHSKEDHD